MRAPATLRRGSQWEERETNCRGGEKKREKIKKKKTTVKTGQLHSTGKRKSKDAGCEAKGIDRFIAIQNIKN